MKAGDIRNLSLDEMKNKLMDLKQELFNLRFQHSGGMLENPKKLGQARKTIARVKTIIRQTQSEGEKE